MTHCWLSVRNGIIHFLYVRLFKHLFFLMDAETAHNTFTRIGSWLGSRGWSRALTSLVFSSPKDRRLEQTLHGITFRNPVGLAAGWDYEGRMPEILEAVGYGFSTIGTVTRQPYEGNPKPRLGRLLKSRSLLVNKGFKNLGIDELLGRYAKKHLTFPVGLSIGKTNSLTIATQREAVEDVVQSFRNAEAVNHPFSHYELNVSCPNLMGDVEFYRPDHLEALLAAVTALNLKRPVFIKMPISETDEQIRSMLDVVVRYPIAGVIFGNLQKNRQDPALDPQEVAGAGKGNFSGKPCERRSNELIALAHTYAGTKLTIIGCGGIFNAQDAYKKIRAGAHLLQMITGMIIEGPQVASEINTDLIRLLERDGYRHLSQAVGVEA